MTGPLSEAEYEAYRNAEIGETVAVATAAGNEYVLQVSDRQGATLIGVGVVDGAPSVVELRGGRGRDDDPDQPFLAVGIGGPGSVETTDVEQGVTHIEGVGEVAVTRESGSVSYDEEAVGFERRGQQTLRLG